MSLTKRERSVAAKFRRYERARAQAKKFYDRADTILADLASQLKVKGKSRLSDEGKTLVLHDLASGDSVIVGWGHGAVRRWELKVVEL